LKKRRTKRGKKLGLALGGGSARGLSHIGVLKVLHKHKIYPDYIAGTSMGAVIGALYCADYSPKKIEEIATTTDWKKIVDFTIPKAGFIEGDLVERKIKRLIDNKDFSDLGIPLKVIAYNIDKHEKAIFSEGSVSKAIRASISIPGVFAPTKIGKYNYIDGGVIDPTPFEAVKEMGADVVIAIDLFSKTMKGVEAPVAKESTLITELREKFIFQELLNIKNYLIPTRWPKFIQKLLVWIFDKFLYPARVLKMIAGKEMFPIVKVMNETLDVLISNLAREKMKQAKVDVKVVPYFKGLGWADLHRVEEFVKVGEEAMELKIDRLKKKLGMK
jgi:predicted acylesterase/phospholipase RssA